MVLGATNYIVRVVVVRGCVGLMKVIEGVESVDCVVSLKQQKMREDSCSVSMTSILMEVIVEIAY